jgi:hypothetical protein
MVQGVVVQMTIEASRMASSAVSFTGKATKMVVEVWS